MEKFSSRMVLVVTTSSKCMGDTNVEFRIWKGQLMFLRENHVAALSMQGLGSDISRNTCREAISL